LSEDYDNPITVAVLASNYDGTETQSEYAKLYVVTAEYDEETWELKTIDVQEKEALSISEYQKLQYRGSSYTYDILYSMLVSNVRDINRTYSLALPEPMKKESSLQGSYLNLGQEKGIARFINVSRIIRGEEDSGTNIPLWYAADNPQNLAETSFVQELQNVEWVQADISAVENSYSYTELGFLGYIINIDIENENGLYRFNYVLDTLKNKATLMISKNDETATYYIAESEALCQSGIDSFRIRTDVTEYIVDDEKGATLPDYREELRYITPIVGDMPGGIVSVETTVSEALRLQGYENTKISDENDLIFWAMSLGKALEEYSVSDVSQIPINDNPDISWNVELAAQEGVGSLDIIGFADSGTVYFRKTYRLYGNKEAFEQYYICENHEIFDLLCELSFGKKIE
jgi:hypothetical protein